MRRTILLLFILAVPSMAFPAVIYVPDDYAKIQDAISSAVNGDTILVRPGTYVTPSYADTIRFKGKSIVVRSDVDGNPATCDIDPKITVIDGNHVGSAVYFLNGEGASSVLQGFTLTNGTNDLGGGIRCQNSSPTIRDNIITGNLANLGGGMYTFDGVSPTVTNCTFSGNSAKGHGGGLFIGHNDSIVSNCIFTGNSANTGGGGMCTNYGNPTVTNCTFSGNSAGYDGGGLYNTSGNPIVTNCIFWNDSPSEIYNYGIPVVTFSCIQGGYSGTGNIDADPLFLDPLTGDFRLQQDPCEPGIINPCVDTGDPASGMMQGSTRSDGVQDAGIVDMGYHYPIYDDFLEVPKEYATIQAAIDAALNKQIILVAPGTYEECINFQGKSIQVRSDGDGNPNTHDISPETTIIDGNQAGSVVTFQNNEGPDSVLEGFTITNGLVAGGIGGGVYCYGSSPVLLDNIIALNQAVYGGGMYNDSGSPSISRCTFLENSATFYGGGMYNYQDSSTLTNCTFSWNSADRGGGLYIRSSSDTIFINCTFSANSAINHGGGLYMLESLNSIITNCTFGENTVGYLGSGICNVKSTAIVTNGILWNNGSDEIYNSTGTTDVTFSCIQGGYSGTGNIYTAPLFLDPLNGDFHLTYASPCIDAGDNNALLIPVKDFEGDARIFPGNGTGAHLVGTPPQPAVVDMGADEYCLLRRKKLK